jgi:RNA polymerase sigma factor (TIGR02999 family)
MPHNSTPASPRPQGVSPPGDPAVSITQLLHSWSGGDQRALDRLVPLVYEELRRLARHHMRSERDAHTLQSTGLVHEAFLRLAQQRAVHWVSRGQFYGWVSQLMRRILVDHARGRNAQKRGEGQPALSLDQLQEDSGDARQPGSNDALLEILKLDEALERMAALDARQSRVVELRFFGGLSVDETAEALEVSPATVKREWSTARAWLLRQMGQPLPSRT